jgi:hypothetical protein
VKQHSSQRSSRRAARRISPVPQRALQGDFATYNEEENRHQAVIDQKHRSCLNAMAPTRPARASNGNVPKIGVEVMPRITPDKRCYRGDHQDKAACRVDGEESLQGARIR